MVTSPATAISITWALVVLLAVCVRVPLTVKELMESWLVPVTVTVCPAVIVTSSEAPGTAPPSQVVVSPQLPDWVEAMAAA